jgi:hypothetical protein
MNDDLSKKLSSISGAFDKANSFGGAKSALDAFMPKIMHNTMYESQALSAVNGVLKNYYIEPKSFNPIMAAFGNVSQMLEQIDIKTSYNSGGMSSTVAEIMRSFSNESAINSFTEVSKKASELLNNFSTFNWRENYPEMFLGDSMLYVKSKQYGKFNKNINKLIDWSVLQEDSTIIDGSVVSLNLDNNRDESFDPEIEEIFKIANQAFEKLNDENYDGLKILNKLLSRLSKFVNHQYTVGFVVGIVMMLITSYYTQSNAIENKVIPNTISFEKLISENEIGIKQKPIKKYKDFEKIPMGSEITIIEKYKLWAKITYINSKGIPQIGYCRIQDLKK